MNLVLLEPHEPRPDGHVTLDDGRAAHLRQVLRVTVGQPVRVGIIDGPLGTGVVTATAAHAVTLCCTFDDTPPRPRVHLLLALPRPKVLRRLWAQLAALGVDRVLLTNAERVERNYFDTHLLDPTVYRASLIEGLQQARDTWLPRVSVHRQFRKLVEAELDREVPAAVRIAADPAAARSVAATVSRASDSVLVAVGPEGGWNAFERALLLAHGFIAVSMGPRTLRSDTACVALLALTHDALRARTLSGEEFPASRPTGSDRT